MFFATVAYWIIGPLLAAYDCWNVSNALSASWELFFCASARAMGLTAIPWMVVMVLFWVIWATCPADMPRSPSEP